MWLALCLFLCFVCYDDIGPLQCSSCSEVERDHQHKWSRSTSSLSGSRKTQQFQRAFSAGVYAEFYILQKMLLKKNCGAKTRVIKIHSINGGRPPPHFVYDPSTFAFRSLSTLKPLSPIAPVEEPSCAY